MTSSTASHSPLIDQPADRPDASCRIGGATAEGGWPGLTVDPFWHDAIEGGDLDAIRDLVGRGADVDALDRHGQTGLMLAARAGRADVVAALIEHGAGLDHTAKFGLSALMLAVVNGHAEVARRLARAGCDLSLRGSGAPGFAGKTARDLAAAQGMVELAAELEPPRGAR